MGSWRFTGKNPLYKPNEQFLVGVSFPAKFLPNYIPSFGRGRIQLWTLWDCYRSCWGFICNCHFWLNHLEHSAKAPMLRPKLVWKRLGVKRGLTAVEASYLLDLKPPQIVTEILYSLLQKRAVWAQETKPSLKLKVLPPFENKTGPKDNPLRYYEIDFLNSLKADGTLDEEKLAHTIMFLRDTVEQKLQGYSRKDTVDYYRKIAAQAWTQVEQAGTVDLACERLR